MSRLARHLPPLLLAAAAALGACSEIGTDPNTPVAIAWDSLPAPSVVLGDSLRDAVTGVARPLNAVAFNGKSDTVRNAPFMYFVRDTGGALEILPGNYVVARKPRDTPVPIVASLENLQVTRALDIVPRPDRLLRAADSVPTTFLATPDTATNATKNLSNAFGVQLVHDTTAPAAPVAVRSWVIFFRVDSSASRAADSVRLVDDQGRLKSNDTTDATGLATVRLRIFAKTQPAGVIVTDSVIVRASARYRGAEVAGSPVRLVVPVIGGSPRTVPAG